MGIIMKMLFRHTSEADLIFTAIILNMPLMMELRQMQEE
jgi:hypothetical protein